MGKKKHVKSNSFTSDIKTVSEQCLVTNNLHLGYNFSFFDRMFVTNILNESIFQTGTFAICALLILLRQLTTKKEYRGKDIGTFLFPAGLIQGNSN